jgi:hypothetical protein
LIGVKAESASRALIEIRGGHEADVGLRSSM